MPIFIFVIRFFVLLLSGLMAGMMIGFGLKPKTGSISDTAYIENLKVFIKAFNRKIRSLLLISIVPFDY